MYIFIHLKKQDCEQINWKPTCSYHIETLGRSGSALSSGPTNGQFVIKLIYLQMYRRQSHVLKIVT